MEAGESLRVPLSGVDIGARELAYVKEAVETGWISGTGPFVELLEERLSAQVGRKQTVAVANGTLAIELALRCLDVGPGDEVIVPALTFAAPAMSVLAVGATPVVADVDPQTWTLAVDSAAAAVTGATRAILAVDVLGHPADYDALEQLGLPIIEDAAEAHGASYKGRPAGSFGTVSVFSFHANKAITTGEGGCVCTDSPQLAERMRVMAHHGIRPGRPYVNEELGRNFRMTSLAAAVGLGQLDRWDELIAARKRVADRYDTLLADVNCSPRPVASWAHYACWLHTVTVEDRPRVLEHLRGLGIDARGIWPPLSDQPVLGGSSDMHPVARRIAGTALWLPTSATLASSEIEFIAGALAEAAGRRRRR
jgi:perosamine synthetase